MLLVEDEPQAAQVLAKGLREQAYAVDIAADGETALFQAGTTDYDALILDLMLPRVGGLAVCRSIRAAGSAVPILMLTARDAVESRIEGLDCGADDYLVKPYDFGELLARLRAVIRRGRQPVLPERMVIGSLTIDTRRRSARVRNAEIMLTAKEYALSNISRAARATSSAAATSRNTSGTNTTIRCRTSSTLHSAAAPEARGGGQDSLIRTRRERVTSSPATRP